MAEVRWSAQALRDLDEIGGFLARSSEAYARALVPRLFDAAERLGQHPGIGRRVPEVDLPHIREIVREGYRIVYLELDEQVELLAVLHSRQHLRRKLKWNPPGEQE